MAVLQSLLFGIAKIAGVGAFLTWWIATYLGIQMSRYRYEPELPAFRRRWEKTMLIFVGLYAVSVVAGLTAGSIGR